MSRYAAVFFLLLCAAVANAGTSVSSLTATVSSRNLTSVAIKAVVSGDDDSSAVLRLFQRYETEGRYDSGMAMVRRTGTNIHEGRILWMTPGRTAYWRIEYADGGSMAFTAWDTVSCAQVRPMVATGPVMYVSPSGVDTSCTGAIGSPCKTITKGLEKLAASTDSGAFGGVIVAPGEYHERVSITFGRDGKPRFLSGNRVNRDSTIICGANEHGEAGRRDVTNNLSWTARAYGTGAGSYASTAGVYMAYLPQAAVGSSYGDSIGSVVIGWGEYLHRKTSLYAVFQDSVGASAQGTLAANGENSGWYWTGDTLYVRRASNATPSGATFHFGYRTNLVSVDAPNWRIANMTVRYGGGKFGDLSNGAEEDPGTEGNGIISARGGGTLVNGLVVDSCLIYGNTGLGVYAAYSSDTVKSDSCTVSNSIFDGLTIGTMGYAAAKGRTEEDANIVKLVGKNSNVFNNVIRETHNGIQTGPSAAPETVDSTFGSGTEIYGNRISKLSDDAIELDTGHGINMLVSSNTVDISGSGISLAPVYDGPVFVVYNTFTRFTSAGLKIGGGNRAAASGQSLFYQNTFASKASASRAFEGISGGEIGDVTAENNVFLGGSITLAGPSAASYDTGCVLRFNYNAVDSMTTGRVAKLQDVFHSWALWKSNYSQDANSQQGSVGMVSLPLFTTGTVNAALKNSTNAYQSNIAVQTGRSIPGVNSGLGGKRYASDLPNIGSRGCADCYYPEP